MTNRTTGVFLCLAIFSGSIPWLIFSEFFFLEDVSWAILIDQATENPVVRSALADLILSAAVVTTFILTDGRERTRKALLGSIISTWLVGVGFGLAVYLLNTKGHRQIAQS